MIRPTYTEIGKELHSALSKIGFVSLIEHGVDPDTVRSVFDASKKFFDELGTEEKLEYPQTEDKKQGYVSPGKEMLDNLKVRINHQKIDLSSQFSTDTEGEIHATWGSLFRSPLYSF